VLKTVKIVFASIICFFVCGALYFTSLITERQTALEEASRYNLQWSSSQAVIELVRLEKALAVTQVDKTPAALDEVRLRYDILINRMSLLGGGEFLRFLRQDPELLETFQDAEKKIQGVAKLMPGVGDPAVAKQALETIEPLSRQFLGISAQANKYGGEQVALDQGLLVRQHWQFSAMVAGLIVCGIMLMMLLNWHNRLLGFTHTRLEATTEKLAASRRQLDAALNNMSQGLSVFDGEGNLVLANRKFARMFGLNEEINDTSLSFAELRRQVEKVGDISLVDILHRHSQRIARQQPDYAYESLDDGRVFSITHRPMENGGSLATFLDVTARRRTEARIEYMATHDTLTGLPNRAQFRADTESAIDLRSDNDNGPAIVMLDIDNFKTINDTMGLPTGDALLCALAGRVKSCLPKNCIAARLGGDEFGILQTDALQPDAAIALAKDLMVLLAEPLDLDGVQVKVRASIGIAMANEKTTNADELLKNADLALNRAKTEGRATYRVFDPEMAKSANLRRQMEVDLREAVVADRFELHYQPIMNIRQGGVAACEALLRWNDPKRGLIPPMEFIPLAEEIGLIGEIGEMVLRKACIEAMSWSSDIKVSVNVSPLQFNSRDLMADVAGALAASGLSPYRLDLEITESVLLAHTEDVLETLHRLRAMGVQISMDDFGTGYSSLNYLRRFPFDKIKIDKSFVRDVDSSEDATVIVRAVTSIAGSLGMITTAEGIETLEQLERVRAGGCAEAQGYLFCRPLPAAKLRPMLDELALDTRAVA
jgi:diguanylate cyclase (GGDEF)-like protein/PAS domain S-box-containing protein